MSSIVAEIRRAVRALARSRGYTAVAILTLALSMGAGAAIFSMADAIVNWPFAFPELSRVMSLAASIPKAGAERYPVSPADYFDWVDRARVFSGLAAFQPWDARATGSGAPQRVRAARVSPGYFPLLGIPPLQGRAFGAEIGEDERHRVVVSYGFWRQRLASDPDAVGRPLQLNGLTYTIAAVMPRQFDFPTYTEVWTPWLATPEERAERGAGSLSVVGRLAPGVSVGQARAAMAAIAADLARRFPSTSAGRGIDVAPLSEVADPYAARYMTVVSAAVVFLLILACANVANLQLVRCAGRRREWALRAALGASRARIARQLLFEGVTLSLAGAVLGLPLASQAMVAIRRSIPPLVLQHLPGLPYAALDSRVLGWALAAAVLIGVAFTAPTLLQVSARRLHEAIRGGGRGAVSAGGRLRNILVVCEIAFALVLLAGAGSIYLAFHGLAPANQGFDPGNVYTFEMRAPDVADAQVAVFYRETLRRVAALREVSSPALISELPALADTRSGAVLVEGRPAPPPERPLLAELRIASPGYFRAFRIALAGGRDLDAHDDANGAPVAVVSRAAALRFWHGQDAIGQRLRIAAPGAGAAWLTVVGIAADVNHFFLDTEIRPVVYVSYLQYPLRSLHVVLQPAAGVERTNAAVRDAIRAVDPSQPVYDFESVGRFFADLSGGVGVLATMVGALALLALLLSAAGVYAIMHYSVAQRTAEIGVRMAMGARPSDIGAMVIRDAFRMAALAICASVPAAWAAGRSLSRLLAGIVALPPAIVAAAAVVVAGSAVLAAWLPARRAARVDPLAAIRRE